MLRRVGSTFLAGGCYAAFLHGLVAGVAVPGAAQLLDDAASAAQSSPDAAAAGADAPPVPEPEASEERDAEVSADGGTPALGSSTEQPAPDVETDASLPPAPLQAAEELPDTSLSPEELPPLPDDPILPPVTHAVGDAVAGSAWLSHGIGFMTAIYPHDLPPGADPVWFELEYRPRLAGDLGRGFQLAAELLLRVSQNMRAGAGATVEGNGPAFKAGSLRTNQDRQMLVVRELVASWAGAGLELAAGWQILNWGRADAVRPLDLFSTQDRTDPLRPETLGLPSLSCVFGRRGWSVDGVWVPSSFTDRIATHAANVWSILPRTPAARYQPAPPDFSLSNGEYGLRGTFSNQAWDLGVLTAWTRDRIPSRLELSRSDDGALIMTPDYIRYWIYGASLLRSLGEYLLKADVAYVDYEREYGAALDDGVRLVAGGEARGTIGANGTYTAILQYALDTTAQAEIVQAPNMVSSPYRWFRHAATASLNTMWAPRFEAQLEVLVELEHAGTAASATFKYHPFDGSSFWCEGSVLAGGRGAWVGRLDDADRILIGVEFQTK